MFVLSVLRESLGAFEEYTPPRYHVDWSLHSGDSLLIAELRKYATMVNMDEMMPGDILAFRYGRCADHVGIYAGNGQVIHSHRRQGVTIWPLTQFDGHLHSAWRVRT